MAASRPLDLRLGLRRFSTGAIAYGVVGLVIALLGLLALVWVNGRLGNIAAEVDTTVDQLAITMDRTARVLRDASASADSFSVTLTNTSDAVNEVSGSLNLVGADLQALEDQLRSVSILGNQPLGSAANAVGRIGDSLQGLQVRLSTIGDSLAGNTDKLAANATSLAALGDSVATLSARLRSGVIESSLDDLQVVLFLTFFVFAGWTAVPAVGGLALGLWIRRTLDESAT